MCDHFWMEHCYFLKCFSTDRRQDCDEWYSFEQHGTKFMKFQQGVTDLHDVLWRVCTQAMVMGKAWLWMILTIIGENTPVIQVLNVEELQMDSSVHQQALFAAWDGQQFQRHLMVDPDWTHSKSLSKVNGVGKVATLQKCALFTSVFCVAAINLPD